MTWFLNPRWKKHSTSSLNSLLSIFNYFRKCSSCSNNTELENPGPALPQYLRFTFLFAFHFFICVLLFHLRFTILLAFYFFICVLPFYLSFQLYFSLFSFFNMFSFLICVFFFYLCYYDDRAINAEDGDGWIPDAAVTACKFSLTKKITSNHSKRDLLGFHLNCCDTSVSFKFSGFWSMMKTWILTEHERK